MHGWDNEMDDMGIQMFAFGPAFKKGFHLDETIENVDIYPLLAHLLHLTPNSHNGSFPRISRLLEGFSESGSTSFIAGKKV